MKRALLLAGASLLFSTAKAQVCDPNIDFETGTYANWWYYSGTPTVDGGGCCPISTPTFNGLGTPLAGRHVLRSGAATDPCCGFPVIDSFGGTYSLMIGDSTGTESKAQRASFHIHVPSSGSFDLIYRYAVVLADPGHAPVGQPRVELKITDSATGAPITGGSWSAVASPGLPGFYTVTTAPCGSSGLPLRCKPWTTETVDLSPYAGQTLIVDWATGDCQYGGHYGYAYVDMDCGLFPIYRMMSCDSTTAHLTAPGGFAGYEWHNAAFTASYGTARTVNVPVPAAGTTKSYALIVRPKPGFGRTDTLYTTLACGNISNEASNLPGNRGVMLYPNPATDELTVEALPSKYPQMLIRNTVGQVVAQYRITNAVTTVKIGQLPAGMYTVELGDSNERIIKLITKE